LAFAASSDRFIAAAWAVGLAALGLTLALALQVLAMRERRALRERRRARVLALWRPLMFEALLGAAPALPRLGRRDEESFLLLWNQLQDGVRGDPRARLNELGERMGAHAMATRRLAKRDALGRLLALRTLGHLGRPADYAQVVPYLDERKTYLCVAAALALVHIDPAAAPGDIVPRLAVRVDWPVAVFATVLSEGNAARLSAAFRGLQRELSPRQVVRLLPLVSILDEETAAHIQEALLAAGDDPEVVVAALKVVRSPSLLPHVRRACEHEAWEVRTQAASALGRVGSPAELPALLRLLRDPQWWVRYRAAQALTSGRFGPADEIARLAGALDDRFARDIFAHALAEGRA
jgi:hypothetical protein